MTWGLDAKTYYLKQKTVAQPSWVGHIFLRKPTRHRTTKSPAHKIQITGSQIIQSRIVYKYRLLKNNIMSMFNFTVLIEPVMYKVKCYQRNNNPMLHLPLHDPYLEYNCKAVRVRVQQSLIFSHNQHNMDIKTYSGLWDKKKFIDWGIEVIVLFVNHS